MSKLQSTLKKAAGLFFEFDETTAHSSATAGDATPTSAGSTKTLDEILRDTPGPNLREIGTPAAPQTPAEPLVTPEGAVNYPAVYRAAGVPEVAFSAEQMLDLLESLPKELPLETRRATMRVTLGAMAKNMGVTTEAIVADASRKLATLSQFSDHYAKETGDYITLSTAEIARMEAEIAQRKAAIEQATQRQQGVLALCEHEGDRLDDVLEFFSLDQGASKYASPPNTTPPA